jgi:hypothetical protein
VETENGHRQPGPKLHNPCNTGQADVSTAGLTPAAGVSPLTSWHHSLPHGTERRRPARGRRRDADAASELPSAACVVDEPSSPRITAFISARARGQRRSPPFAPLAPGWQGNLVFTECSCLQQPPSLLCARYRHRDRPQLVLSINWHHVFGGSIN